MSRKNAGRIMVVCVVGFFAAAAGKWMLGNDYVDSVQFAETSAKEEFLAKKRALHQDAVRYIKERAAGTEGDPSPVVEIVEASSYELWRAEAQRVQKIAGDAKRAELEGSAMHIRWWLGGWCIFAAFVCFLGFVAQIIRLTGAVNGPRLTADFRR
jgi:hypothetical protein